MVDNKIVVGQIDTGIHPGLPYLADLNIRLTTLDKEGRPHAPAKRYKGDLHGSQVASIICGPYYDDDLPRITEIEAINIPRMGKMVLCLLRALDAMLSSEIHVLCLPVGINLPTPVFRPFMQAFAERGVLVVAPSGNKGRGTVLTPGGYPEVLTVGALTPAGNVAGYSGRWVADSGPGLKPDLYARGEFPDPADLGSGKMIRGTSFACAYVTGKAARIWQKSPEGSIPEIRAKLGLKPAEGIPIPSFSDKPYIDNRLKTAVRLGREKNMTEGIIVSGVPGEVGRKPFSMEQMLNEVEQMAGYSPGEVHYFGRNEVVHLRAPVDFFKLLLSHQGLFCAQAVDVNMFEM